MRQKLFTQGITVFLKPQMYEQLKKESDERRLGMSELIRCIVDFYFDYCEDWNRKKLEEERLRDLEMEKALEEKEEDNE